MNENTLSFNEFKTYVENQMNFILDRPLLRRGYLRPAGLEAVKDFWQHWSSFHSLIAKDRLELRPVIKKTSNASTIDVFDLPPYKRISYASAISLLGGFILIWFIWQLGIFLVVAGFLLFLLGNYLLRKDFEIFSQRITHEALNGGPEKLCCYYIIGLIELKTTVGRAAWPQYPSNAITGAKSVITVDAQTIG